MLELGEVELGDHRPVLIGGDGVDVNQTVLLDESGDETIHIEIVNPTAETFLDLGLDVSVCCHVLSMSYAYRLRN